MSRFARCGGLSGFRVWAAALALPSATSNAEVSSSGSTGEDGDRSRSLFSCSFSQSRSSSHLLPGPRVPCSETIGVSPSAPEGGNPSCVGTASQKQHVRGISFIKEHHDPFSLECALKKKKTRAPSSPRESRGASSCQAYFPRGDCTACYDTKLNFFRRDCYPLTTAYTTKNSREKQSKRSDRMGAGGGKHKNAVCENLYREGLTRKRRQRTDTLRDVQNVPLSKQIRHSSTCFSSLAAQVSMNPLSSTIAACKEPLPSSGCEPSSPVFSSTVPSCSSTVSPSRSPSPSLDSPASLHSSPDPDLAVAVHRAVEGLRVRQKNEQKQTEGHEEMPTDSQSSPLISHPLVIPDTLLRKWRGVDKGERKESQASSHPLQQQQPFSSTPSSSSVIAGERRPRVPLSSSVSHVGDPRPRDEGTEKTTRSSEMLGNSEGDKPLPGPRKFSLNESDFAHLETRWLKFLERSRPYGHLSAGNSVKIYDNGDKAFTAMLRSIKNAKKNVLMETYIFDQSRIGLAVKDALCEAALRGCFVLLVVDWLGGFSMPRSWHDELLASGVRLVIFNPPLPVLLRTTLFGGDDSSSSSSAAVSRSYSSFSHAIATAKLALVYCKHLFSTLFSTSSSNERPPPSLSLPSSSAFLLESSTLLPSAPLQDSTQGTEPEVPLCAERVGPIPFRDHRKSLVIDGEVAFVGSLNVSEDAVGERYGGKQRFYDLHVRVRGPAAKQVQALVLETLATANAKKIAVDLLTHLTRQEERDEHPWHTHTVVNERPDTSQGIRTWGDTFVIGKGSAVHEKKLPRIRSLRGDRLVMTREEERSREGSEIGSNGQEKFEKMTKNKGVGDEQVMNEQEAAPRGSKQDGEERTSEPDEEELEGESEEKHGQKVQARGRVEKEAGKEGEGEVDLFEGKTKEKLGESKKKRPVRFHCQKQRHEDVKGENLCPLERSSISHNGDGYEESQRSQGVPTLSASSAVTTLFSSLSSYVFRSTSPHSSASSSSLSESRSLTPGDSDNSLLSPVPAGRHMVTSTSPYLSPSSEERERAPDDPGEKPSRPMTPTKKLLETPRRLLFSWMAEPCSKETASCVDSIEAKRREEEQDDDVDDAHDVLIQVLESNVLRNQRSIQAVLKNAIYNATVSLYVTTSYFVPPGFLRRALQAALARDGVDVFLLLSGDSDVWGDVYATTYVVRKFLSKKRRHSFLTADWEVDPSVTRKITVFFSSLLPTNRWNSPEAYCDLFQVGNEDEREREESPPPLAAVEKSEELQRALGPINPEASAISGGVTSGFSSRGDEARRGSVTGMKKKEQDLQGAQEQERGAISSPRARGSLLPASEQIQKNFVELEDAKPVVSLAEADERTLTSSSSFFSTWKPIWGGKGSQMNDAKEGEREEDERTAVSTRDVWQAQQFWRALRERQEPRGEACVYFLTSQHCHAKNIVVDHLWSTVGSFNFDRQVLLTS
ncbi:phospholipase d active site domain-containing protein [Cystoisospora suis]|uniref:Phospholipase d active site domain-containing protein n=1 Tax=Cystoisospora suis TaxID=483139 RepID=A0A2C6KWP1_9APIC|nr:phospholipase d active site domain-containing protein [Cystoisospora suis]